MAYFVALVSAWLVLSGATALRPGRRGIFAALAYPVGWAAGELAFQALVFEGLLLALLWWWGWPVTHWLFDLVVALAVVVALENLALVAVSFYARVIVRRAMADPLRPLEVPRAKDDHFGSWWRTALQVPFHPRYMQIHHNVAYGPEPRHRLDVWRNSTTPKGAPVIFYIHGGAWTFGDKRDQGRPMLHEFVERGWVAVSCNYRLAPRHPWPAQIEDVTRTLGWVKKYIANYGGDPERVVVAGGSAGGHLASLLALSAEDATWRPRDFNVEDWSVRGCMSFYGVLEMTGDETHWYGLGRGLRKLLERHVVQRPYEGNEALYEEISPLHRLHEGAPAFLVVQGMNDTLVDVHVARGFVERFAEVASSPVYYVELRCTQHAFDVSASARTSATTRAAVAFAQSVVTPAKMSAALEAKYQAAALSVEVAPGRWVEAAIGAEELGDFFVVTSDNPFSEWRSDEQNVARRAVLRERLATLGVEVRPSVARASSSSSSGEWPEEHGYALVGVSNARARALARAFDQFAYYEVRPSGVLVRGAFTRL